MFWEGGASSKQDESRLKEYEVHRSYMQILRPEYEERPYNEDTYGVPLIPMSGDIEKEVAQVY